MAKFTFSKKERLKSSIQISKLFKSGNSFAKFPIRVLWTIQSIDPLLLPQVCFAVPKKKFANATDRNLLKRRMKEAYRLQKHILTEQSYYGIQALFLFTSSEIVDYKSIEKSMIKILKQLKEIVVKID